MSQNKKLLLLVDMQNDFCPGGALSVPEGDAIIPVLNKYIDLFKSYSFPIFASRDWHPVNTKHFKAQGGVWPKHCVKNTRGADFREDLKLPAITKILSKGIDPDKGGYSVFEAQDENQKYFEPVLKENGIREIFIGGLATDYCVKNTVLDALKMDFKVYLLSDGIKGVDLNPNDSQKAIEEMTTDGAQKVNYEEVVRMFAA